MNRLVHATGKQTGFPDGNRCAAVLVRCCRMARLEFTDKRSAAVRAVAPRSMGLVYSTESGRTCARCRRALASCTCKPAVPTAAGDGIVRVSRETKGRGGKAVTLVRGVPLPADELAALAKQLRSACGAGGTVKDGVLEVQGDHVERVMALLQQQGWKVKRAGG